MTAKSDINLISPKLNSFSKLQDRVSLFAKEQTPIPISNAAKLRQNSQTRAKTKSNTIMSPRIQHILQPSTRDFARTSEEKRLYKSTITFLGIRQYPHSYYFIPVSMLAYSKSVRGREDSMRRVRSTANVKVTLIRLQYIKNSFFMMLFLVYVLVAVVIKYY